MNHTAFVRAFHGSRRKLWAKKGSNPTGSVVTAYREFMDFDKDFRGFCSVLKKCAESQERPTKELQRQDSSQPPYTQEMD